MSKVSIIIPAYNQAQFLPDAVESILNQSHQDIEVIVVDDGSTDNTPEVLAKYAEHTSVKLIHQENAGLSAARNRGLAEATGAYVCFLDSDDYFTPDKVEKQASLLDDNPELGFVYCDIVAIDAAGEPLEEQCGVAHSDREMSGNIFQSLLLGGYFPPHTVMLRRSILDELDGFDLDCGGHADYELWLRISAAGYSTCFQPEALAFYRHHSDSMSKDGDHMDRTRVLAFQKIARRFPDELGRGLNGVQKMNEDLFKANDWLQEAYGTLQEEYETQQRELFMMRGGGDAGSSESGWPMLEHIDALKILNGAEEQIAVWECVIYEQENRMLLLQPPVSVEVEVPVSTRGYFKTAVTIHPDVWEKPKAGACTFRVMVNKNISYSLIIDPVNCETDRHWHEIRLDIPESEVGKHTIVLETESPNGVNDFRWALWRYPVFISEDQLIDSADH